MGEGELTVEVQELDGHGEPHGNGRFETLAADTVILALWQESDSGFLRSIPSVEFNQDVVRVSPTTLMTGAAGVFAGGDAVPSQRTVTVGVGHGKRAARSIHAYLRSAPYVLPDKRPVADFDTLNLWYLGDHDRRVQDELDPQARTAGFDEVVAGLTPQDAAFEAGRCLSCGNCFECDGCLGSCPEDAIIKLGKGQRYRFDYTACTGCGTCYRQCPSMRSSSFRRGADDARHDRRERGRGRRRLPRSSSCRNGQRRFPAPGMGQPAGEE